MKRLLLAAALAAGCGGQQAAAPAAPASAPATQTSSADKKAADFTLVDSDGKQVALHDLLKNGPVILAFFPKAFTGG